MRLLLPQLDRDREAYGIKEVYLKNFKHLCKFNFIFSIFSVFKEKKLFFLIILVNICHIFFIQHTLAKLYIELLGLGKDSPNAQKLLNYRAPKTGKSVKYISLCSIVMLLSFSQAVSPSRSFVCYCIQALLGQKSETTLKFKISSFSTACYTHCHMHKLKYTTNSRHRGRFQIWCLLIVPRSWEIT